MAEKREEELKKVQGTSSSVEVTPSETQKAATGPFMAYVNLQKPVLQKEQPGLSLLDTLKELASRWNQMKKENKEKYAIIARAEEEKNTKPNNYKVRLIL